jgi:hypothetical protein
MMIQLVIIEREQRRRTDTRREGSEKTRPPITSCHPFEEKKDQDKPHNERTRTDIGEKRKISEKANPIERPEIFI